LKSSSADTRNSGAVDLSTTKVISETFFVSATRVIFLGLKPVRGILLGGLLGPALYGMLNVPIPYIQIFVILSNIGFNTAIVKLMPDRLQAGRKDLALTIYRAALILTVSLSVIWTVLLILFAPQIARTFARNPDAVQPLVIYSLIIPFMAVNALYAALYFAVQRGKLRAMITAVHGFLNIILPVIAALVWRQRVTPVIAGFLTAEIVGAFFFFALFHRNVLVGFGRRTGTILGGMREIFAFGFLFFFANLGWDVLNSVDRLMVTYYLPIEQYGFYAMAAQIITALSIIAASAGVALVPSLTVARSAGDAAMFDRQVRNTARLTFIVLVPFVMLAFVTAQDLFAVILPSFLPSVPILRILVFIGFVDILCRVAWAALVAHGRGGMVAIAYVSAALWNITWNRLLIPPYGLVGAAAATLSSFVVLAIVLQSTMWKASGTYVRPARLLHPLLVSLVFPLLGFALGSVGHIWRIIVICAAGSVLYAFFALRTGLVTRNDLMQARNIAERRAPAGHAILMLRVIGLLERVRGARDRS
jgi:stage V sporulation protein B